MRKAFQRSWMFSAQMTDSLGQQSLFDFFIVSADLFRSGLDIRGKTGAELSTNHHPVVCNAVVFQ